LFNAPHANASEDAVRAFHAALKNQIARLKAAAEVFAALAPNAPPPASR
jgi:hypothetical protein